jgi:hypothetical protein
MQQPGEGDRIGSAGKRDDDSLAGVQQLPPPEAA